MIVVVVVQVSALLGALCGGVLGRLCGGNHVKVGRAVGHLVGFFEKCRLEDKISVEEVCMEEGLDGIVDGD